MDGESGPMRQRIVNKLCDQIERTQRVYNQTFATLDTLKETLHEISSELDDAIEERGHSKVQIEYRDRGTFEAQLQVADEMLIFVMHTNVFELEANHPARNTPYLSENPDNAFCGVIHIYNFLSDSFKHKRATDEGYLIGRLYVNGERRYFVEGISSAFAGHEPFGAELIDRAVLIRLVEQAIDFSLDFKLVTPAYSDVERILVDDLSNRTEHAKTPTGKRLGMSLEKK